MIFYKQKQQTRQIKADYNFDNKKLRKQPINQTLEIIL